jgi:hypothetical protein
MMEEKGVGPVLEGSLGTASGWEPVDPVKGQYLSPRKPSPKELRDAGKDKRLKRPRSKRSGGPQSAAGRARTAQNAVKHGAYGLHPTQLDLYHEKLRGVQEELNPQGVIGKTLCGDIAHSLTRLETLNSYEREAIRRAEHGGVNLLELARRVNFPWPNTHLELLGAPQAQGVLQSQVLRMWRVLAKPPGCLTGRKAGSADGSKLHAIDNPQSDAEVPVAMGLVCEADVRVQRLYHQGCEVLSTPLNPFEQDHFLQLLDVVMLEARQGLGYFGRRLASRGDTSALVAYWLLRNQALVQETVNELQYERTLSILTDDKIARARAYVQRGLREGISALAEVRSLRAVAWE